MSKGEHEFEENIDLASLPVHSMRRSTFANAEVDKVVLAAVVGDRPIREEVTPQGVSLLDADEVREDAGNGGSRWPHFLEGLYEAARLMCSGCDRGHPLAKGRLHHEPIPGAYWPCHAAPIRIKIMEYEGDHIEPPADGRYREEARVQFFRDK